MYFQNKWLHGTFSFSGEKCIDFVRVTHASFTQESDARTFTVLSVVVAAYIEESVWKTVWLPHKSTYKNVFDWIMCDRKKKDIITTDFSLGLGGDDDEKSFPAE